MRQCRLSIAAFRACREESREAALHHLIGIGLKVASTLVLMVMAALMKLLSETMPVGEVMFARSFFALLPLSVWLMWRGEFPHALRTHNIKGHVLRGGFGGVALASYLVALTYLPLPDVTAIQFLAPLLTLALATVLLGEVVGIFRWSAVGVGFIGIVLILWPYLGHGWSVADEGAIGALVAVVAASLTSLAMIQVRHLTGSETTGSIVFYFSVMCAVMALFTLPFGWAIPDPREAALLVTIGLIGGIGQILLTQSYRFAPASVIAPFDYTAMIWSLILGYLVFGDVPVAVTLIGASIVIAAGLFIIWRERQLGIERARQRQAGPPPA